MMWEHEIGWHWLGTLAIVLFWMLIIVLALAPTKYLRSELSSPELQPVPADGDLSDTGRDGIRQRRC